MVKNKDILIVDIREAEFFKQFSLPNSINYQISDILDNPELIPKDKKVIIVCQNGNNSMAIIDYLNKKLAYQNIYNLKGGISTFL